jgi:tetratricopeptide (TPR) repeat protein
MLSLTVLMLVFLQGPAPLASLVYRAKQDIASGRYSEARNDIHAALKLAPQDPALWSYLGITDYKLHDSGAAIADFRKACTLDPRNALNYFNLGMLYHEQGDLVRTLDNYRRGLAFAPDDTAAEESYARALIEAHKYREAIGPLEKVKTYSPSNCSIRRALIQSYLKAGLNPRGSEEIQEFVNGRKCSPIDQIDLATLLVEDRQLDAARWVLEHVVQVAPDLADARAGLGIVFIQMGRYQNAREQLRRAVQLSPDSAEYAMRYAEALLLSKEYPAALKFLESVSDRFGKLPEYRYKLGLAYYGLSAYPSAIEELRALVRDYPNLDRAQYYLGHSYSASGNLREAEIHYRKALALNPRDASYYAALGHVLSDENAEEAVSYLEKALQLDPSDTLSKRDLAIYYERKARYRDAEHLLAQVVRDQPTLVWPHYMLAQVYYRQGKKEQGDREAALAAGLDSKALRREGYLINSSPRGRR